MDLLKAIILGIIQGLTEFLPVSSSGHLVLFERLFGLNAPGLQLEVVLHLGTLVPVFIVFRKDIMRLLRNPFQKYVLWLIIGTIPAVAFTLLFKKEIDVLFNSGNLLWLGFIITGLVLLYADYAGKGKKKDDDITAVDSLVVGVMQAIAICPAISRSGSTISASLFRKFDKETAARFSFLLSIPAILGGAVVTFKDVIGSDTSFSSSEIAFYAGGFIAAALTGYLAITFMLKLIKERKLRYFSYYVFALAAVLLADQLIFKVIF